MVKTSVSFETGKYTIVHDEGLDLHILRYGGPWVEIGAVPFPKMFIGILGEVEELRAERDKALAASNAAGFVGCTPAQVIEMQDFNITALEKTAKHREEENTKLRDEILMLRGVLRRG